MAKSNYLSLILFIVAVWFCGDFSSHTVAPGAKPRGTGSYLFAQSSQVTDQRTLLCSVFTGEIGVRERSNRNDGSRVEEYLAYTGNKKGDPWCASFVCWALAKAGIANPRSAWSPALFPARRLVWKNSWPQKKERPQSGDVFGIWFNSRGRIAHCGFIAVWGPSQVITVEGNTNESGSREGDGVYRKRRLKNSLYAVADWISGKEYGNEI